jgi:hypothetical protein
MPLLDFDSIVINSDFYTKDEFKETLKFFNQIGIRKFIVLKSIDPALDSTYKIKNQLKVLNETVKYARPRGAVIKPCANVMLSPKVTQNSILQDLTLHNTNIIFVQPPIFVTNEWLQPDLNYLLYKQKLKPCFTFFEQTYLSCDPTVTHGLYKIQSAALCVDLDFISSLQHEDFLKKCIKDNKLILPAVSRDIKSYYPIINRFQCMNDRMGKTKYLRFCKYINQSASTVFKLL